MVRAVATPIGIRALGDDAFDEMANNFQFAAQLAVHKIVRGDLLIALHLSLRLVTDCLALALYNRDVESATRYHRSGQNSDAEQLSMLETTRRAHTATGILNSIEQSALAFDRLASLWAGRRAVANPTLLALIADARTAISR